MISTPSVFRRAFSASVLLALVATVAVAQPALRERMLIAEDQRAASSDDLNALRQGLASRDAATRQQAVRAIGRLERPDLMPAISRLLTDPNDDVRAETVNAIGQLARGPEGVAAATTRLYARLKGEQTPRVRGVVAATLGRLAFASAADVQQAEKTIAALVPLSPQVVNLDEIAGAVEGLEALIRQSGKLSPPSVDTISRLRVATDLEGRAQDTAALVRIRKLATAALTAANRVDRKLLEAGVADQDDEVRRLTMVAARGDVEDREAIVRKGLTDAEPRVRYEALQTWGRTLQKQSCGPLVDALRDANPHVMLLAIDLAGNGCPEPQSAGTIRSIAETVTASRSSWHAPAHAIVALARMAPDDARKLLKVFVSHPVWQVRMYAAHAAGRLNAADDLVTLGRDPNDNVREAALSELITLKRPEAAPVALEALTRPDYQLIMTAARALTATSDRKRAVPALVATLERLTAEKRDTSRDPRMAILTRLDELAAPEPEALKPYLSDFDSAIARKTAEILQKRTGGDITAVPRPLPIPPVRWRDVTALHDVRLRFAMVGRGAFELRLLVDDAPLTVLRVVTRAREGYYNGLTFHRVVPNFVIQGGSPAANEYAGDGPYMRDEVGLLSHRRGTVGISTRGRDTGDAQIFVNLVDLPRLDHTYTVFAEVVAGMEVVDAILEGDVIERVEVIAEPSRRPSQ
jgi:cyclophilin family peptidyl-prolyl cis-trans isomerase/HEAT repeat protein